MNPTELRERKRELRREAFARRSGLADPDGFSRRIWSRLSALPEYARAGTVSLYLDVRSEVRTRFAVPGLWAAGKRVAVPFCDGDELGLFYLHDMSDLEPGTLDILEPRAELRRLPERRADVRDMDLVIVPGVAFDPRGARLGHGKGYYDRLLRRARPATLLAAPAFECQIFPEIPLADHDIAMDVVITEEQVYQGTRRRR